MSDLKQEFEQWAKSHGAVFLEPAENDTCGNGWFPATYHYPMAEIAWRAFANARALAQANADRVDAARDVLAERQRQVEQEGWTPSHDDEHTMGQLSLAASAYIDWTHGEYAMGRAPFNWPWDSEWFKPGDVRRNLVKAGALILAEIERLDRAASKTTDPAAPHPIRWRTKP